jgi:hypothetical protein
MLLPEKPCAKKRQKPRKPAEKVPMSGRTIAKNFEQKYVNLFGLQVRKLSFARITAITVIWNIFSMKMFNFPCWWVVDPPPLGAKP